MANLEKIVRPFASRSLTPGNLAASDGEPPGNIILQYGKSGGSTNIISGSYSLAAKWYMTKQEKEPPDDEAGEGESP